MPTPCITTQHYHSPCGELLLGSIGGKLFLCDWLAGEQRSRAARRLQRQLRATMEDGDSPTLQQAAAELDGYFAGERRTFSVPLLTIGTDFQKRTWRQLLCIPYGSTISYSEQARRLGIPTATRAVARANGANALALFIPCHRVIGSNGTLTGYAGGLATKRFLLEREHALPSQGAFPCLHV